MKFCSILWARFRGYPQFYTNTLKTEHLDAHQIHFWY
jgi:hypothetical protein